jgi:hypothetical protein
VLLRAKRGKIGQANRLVDIYRCLIARSHIEVSDDEVVAFHVLDRHGIAAALDDLDRVANVAKHLLERRREVVVVIDD